MWVTPDQSRADVIGLYQRAWRHSDATIAALPLDAIGQVPWWGNDGTMTLNHAVVHLTAETQRPAGHADILRELLDGAVGLLREHGNIPSEDPAWWRDYRDHVERAARGAGAALQESLAGLASIRSACHEGPPGE